MRHNRWAAAAVVATICVGSADSRMVSLAAEPQDPPARQAGADKPIPLPDNSFVAQVLGSRDGRYITVLGITPALVDPLQCGGGPGAGRDRSGVGRPPDRRWIMLIDLRTNTAKEIASGTDPDNEGLVCVHGFSANGRYLLMRRSNWYVLDIQTGTRYPVPLISSGLAYWMGDMVLVTKFTEGTVQQAELYTPEGKLETKLKTHWVVKALDDLGKRMIVVADKDGTTKPFLLRDSEAMHPLFVESNGKVLRDLGTPADKIQMMISPGGRYVAYVQLKGKQGLSGRIALVGANPTDDRTYIAPKASLVGVLDSGDIIVRTTKLVRINRDGKAFLLADHVMNAFGVRNKVYYLDADQKLHVADVEKGIPGQQPIEGLRVETPARPSSAPKDEAKSSVSSSSASPGSPRFSVAPVPR